MCARCHTLLAAQQGVGQGRVRSLGAGFPLGKQNSWKRPAAASLSPPRPSPGGPSEMGAWHGHGSLSAALGPPWPRRRHPALIYTPAPAASHPGALIRRQTGPSVLPVCSRCWVRAKVECGKPAWSGAPHPARAAWLILGWPCPWSEIPPEAQSHTWPSSSGPRFPHLSHRDSK